MNKTYNTAAIQRGSFGKRAVPLVPTIDTEDVGNFDYPTGKKGHKKAALSLGGQGAFSFMNSGY